MLTPQLGASELLRFLKLQWPNLTIAHVSSLHDLLAVSPELRCRARLIGFATDVVVPAAILDVLGFGAYNFHPGPPSHPGWAPHCFAIYDRARVFGATAHVMLEKVDAGPIVGIELFPMPADTTPEQLSLEGLRAMLRLFRRLAPRLVCHAGPPTALPLVWGEHKRSRADLAKMCAIPAQPDDAEQAHRSACPHGGRCVLSGPAHRR